MRPWSASGTRRDGSDLFSTTVTVEFPLYSAARDRKSFSQTYAGSRIQKRMKSERRERNAEAVAYETQSISEQMLNQVTALCYLHNRSI